MERVRINLQAPIFYTCRLQEPIACKGSGGLWPLPSIILNELLEQLRFSFITYFHSERTKVETNANGEIDALLNDDSPPVVMTADEGSL